MASKIKGRGLLYCAVVGCLIIASVVIALRLQHRTSASDTVVAAGRPAANNPRSGTRVCGQPILRSPFSYDGPAGRYTSGRSGLPTYGKPGSDFPSDTAGVILPADARDYASYQLAANTVYYLLPGVQDRKSVV